MRRLSDRPGKTSALIVSPVVAVLYVAIGLITLGLSQMSGLASPVWPAAGVAFAAVLHWGWRVLPGVFVGSFSTNMLWLVRMGEHHTHDWLAATAIGVGATLGAAVGAALVHRFVGPVRRLDTPRAVMLTLALGGLLATMIAPTIGVAAQLSAGLLGTGKAWFGWLTWWVGDSIGVIVFAPLILMAMPSQAAYWAGRRSRIAVPSLLIFALLMAGVAQNSARERARVEGAALRLGENAAAALSQNIAVHEEVLSGLRGLLNASEFVTAKEFNAYVRDVFTRFPNLQAVSWNPLITAKDLGSFEASQRAQPGLGNFTVTERDTAGKLRPVTPRPAYVVVAYIEPITKNRGALGFDIYSNPERAAAIDKARDTGATTATVPIDLVQERGTQKGMLALMPTYTGGYDPGTEQARRASLRGFAVAVYRLSDLLAQTFRGSDWDGVAVTLTDVSDPAKPITIADLPARDATTPDHVSAPTATTSPLSVYGRSWELKVHPTSAEFGESRNGLTALLLLAALAVTLLLEAFLLVLSGMESMARRLMSELNGAARYVTSILPRDLEAPVSVTSSYVPSEELGGDTFDYRWIDDDHLIAYVVDVSGHGVAPAMFSVSVHNLLRSGTLDHETLLNPGRVLTELNRLFQMDQQAGNYFTIWYGVYQRSTHILSYARAGHPPPIILTSDGSEPVQLQFGSVPIGVLENTTYETHHQPLHPGADLLIYSDGAFELVLPGGERWSLEEFIQMCASTARAPHWTVDGLVDQLRKRSETGRFDDDCTLVRLTVPLSGLTPDHNNDGSAVRSNVNRDSPKFSI